MTDLSFSQVVRANLVRRHRWHAAGRRWEPADWGNAVAGENGELMTELVDFFLTCLRVASKVGESNNTIKKLQRLIDGHRSENDPGRHYESIADAKQAVLKEMCDAIHYYTILAGELDLDLPRGMIDVFNAVSERYGFPERLVPERLVEEQPE